MPLRVLEYVVQVFKQQTRDQAQLKQTGDRPRLAPVLPIVFYTGTREWKSVGRMIDLIEPAGPFAAVTPLLDPLFVNLNAIAPEKLEAEGGYFGSVLRLIRERQAPLPDFQAALRHVVKRLEEMPQGERTRWLELLSYIHALVYHARDPAERPKLQDVIERSVKTDSHRQEVFNMGRTIADALREEGEVIGILRDKREVLIRQLTQQFGKLPRRITLAISANSDPAQLDEWLDRVLIAESLDDMRID